MPSGTLTKKMPRQLQSWAMRPPKTGPTMPPIGKMLVNMARALSRSRPKWSATMPDAEGMKAPPPMAWISRKATSM